MTDVAALIDAPPQPSGQALRPIIALGVIATVALGLRLWDIAGDSFWIDEIRAVLGPSDQALLPAVREHFGPLDPPGQFVLADLLARLPISLELSGRLPAAVAGAAETGLIGVLVHRIGRRWDLALLASALVAVAPFAVRYGQEARSYTLFSALHLAAWITVIDVCRSIRAGERASTSRAAVGWAVITTISVYIHFFAWPVALAHAAIMLIAATRAGGASETRLLLSRLVVPVIAFLPWAIYEAALWLPDPPRDRLTYRPPGAIDVEIGPDLFGRLLSWLLTDQPWAPLVLLAAAIVIVGGLFAGAGPLRVATGWATAYVLIMTVVIAILSILNGTYFAVRRVEFLVPVVVALIVFAAGAIAASTGARWVPAATAAVFGVMFLPPLTRVYHEEKMALLPVFEFAATADRPVFVGRFVEGGPDAWFPSFVRYADAKGIDVDLIPLAGIDLAAYPASGSALWLTGTIPDDPRFAVVAGNARDDISPIASDASYGTQLVFGAYLSETSYASTDELIAQATYVATLPFSDELG